MRYIHAGVVGKRILEEERRYPELSSSPNAKGAPGLLRTPPLGELVASADRMDQAL
jgi:hypothetical protein